MRFRRPGATSRARVLLNGLDVIPVGHRGHAAAADGVVTNGGQPPDSGDGNVRGERVWFGFLFPRVNTQYRGCKHDDFHGQSKNSTKIPYILRRPKMVFSFSRSWPVRLVSRVGADPH